MIDEMTTVLEPSPLLDFVETKYIKDITSRALAYTKAGFPVHFRGVSGSGVKRQLFFPPNDNYSFRF